MTLQENRRWAVILAGGSGTRLQSLTRRMFGEGPAGEARPKQFCTLFGNHTLLGHTRARVASVVSPERTTFVVMQAHAPYFGQDFADVAPNRILAQPVDRGTTAAIAYSLARIAAVDPDAVAGFFPADHYFADEDAFRNALEIAYRLAESCGDPLLLLGAQPEHPEVEYGWIEPGEAVHRSVVTGPAVTGPAVTGPADASMFRVRRFWEKPSADLARRLLDRGCLWNTFVMIGRVRTFLAALKESVPAVFWAFKPILDRTLPDLTGAADLTGQAYSSLASGDFSKQVLSALPDRLAVLRLDNVGWSDLGTPERLMAMWSRFGVKPLTAA